jgi:hypothetical protein
MRCVVRSALPVRRRHLARPRTAVGSVDGGLGVAGAARRCQCRRSLLDRASRHGSRPDPSPGVDSASGKPLPDQPWSPEPASCARCSSTCGCRLFGSTPAFVGSCADRRGPATPVANSQPSTYDRLSGTHRPAAQAASPVVIVHRAPSPLPSDVGAPIRSHSGQSLTYKAEGLADGLRSGSRDSLQSQRSLEATARSIRNSTRWAVSTGFAGSRAGLVREELQGLLDELLVELEDSAVAGVGVDHQLVVRQTSGHVEGVRRRQHPVVVAVGEEHGLADA